MGTPWCQDLEVVSVPQGATAKPFTLIHPYYDNPGFLSRQLAWWATYPAEVRAHVSAILVDDGSPLPAADVLRAEKTLPFPIRLFRIDVDVRWNWLAARNIGFHHAPDGWCLVTDIDHVVPASTAAAVMYGQHDPRVMYAFSRREYTGEDLTPHSCSWLLTRALFWKFGGYDEALSGHYGTDGEARRRMALVGHMKVLTDRLIRHEYVGDSSTTRYLRKQPEDAGAKALISQRGKGWKPKTLSFPYHEVVAQTVGSWA